MTIWFVIYSNIYPHPALPGRWDYDELPIRARVGKAIVKENVFNTLL